MVPPGLASAMELHVKLIGALDGQRFCLPGVGEAPEYLVPVRAFPAQDILKFKTYLVKLTRGDKGWEVQRDEATNEPVLSNAPVAYFLDAIHGLPYMRRSLGRIANMEGEVAVVFGFEPPVVSFETRACADVSGVSTPRSDEGRFC